MNKLGFILTAAVLVFVVNVPAFASDCPPMPEQINKDWEVEVNAAIAKIGPVKGGELRTRTKNATKDLLSKLPDSGRVYLEQMMYSAYCSALRDDKTMKASERAKLLMEYNREVRKAITTAPSSLAKPAMKPSKKSGSIGSPKNPVPSDQMQRIADARPPAAKQIPTGVTPREKMVYEFRKSNWFLGGEEGPKLASLSSDSQGTTVMINVSPYPQYTYLQLGQHLFEKGIRLVPGKWYTLAVHVTVDKADILRAGFFEWGSWAVAHDRYMDLQLKPGENHLRASFEAKRSDNLSFAFYLGYFRTAKQLIVHSVTLYEIER